MLIRPNWKCISQLILQIFVEQTMKPEFGNFYSIGFWLLIFLVFSWRPAVIFSLDSEETADNSTAIVPGAPWIKEHPMDVIIPEGEPATLNCKAGGVPAPEIVWYKDEEPVSTAFEETRVLMPSGSLFFLRVLSGKMVKSNNTERSDSGTYWCVAKNIHGEVRSRAAQLRIAMLRDEFRTRPRNVQAVVSQQAIIECSPPRGFPDPVVSWRKNGTDLGQQDDSRLNVHSSGNLIIEEVKQSDSGFYTCVAINMVGTKESNPARLSVTNNATDDLDLEFARKRLSAKLVELQEVKSINSTAAKLFWRRITSEPLIRGYYIKWQGPVSKERSWINVTSATVTSYTVPNLKSYTTYSFFVIPYFRTVEGAPSNIMNVTTAEAPPTSPPNEVVVRMMNLTTLRISWRPPSPNGINGLLKGYQIVVLGNETKFLRNVTTNERAASVTLFHLIPGMSYRVQVAAFTGAGVGNSHVVDKVTMDEVTLADHIAMAMKRDNARNPSNEPRYLNMTEIGNITLT